MGPKGKGTGIFHDYWNEFSARHLLYQTGGFSAVLTSLRQSPMPRYYERYPAEKSRRQASGVVRDLDRIIERMNATQEYTLEQFLTDVEEARGLIYGKDKQPLTGSGDPGPAVRVHDTCRNGNTCRTAKS